MNPLSLGMDVLLAILLLTAVVTGVRLNGRLKALKAGQIGFAKAVAELNLAANKADSALKALHAASEDAHDNLLTRIETARGLILKLEKAGDAAQKIAVRAEEASARTLPASPPASVFPPAVFAAPAHAPPAPSPSVAAAPCLAQPTTSTLRRTLDELLAARGARPSAGEPQTRPPAISPRRRAAADEDLFADVEAAPEVPLGSKTLTLARRR